MTAIKDVFGKSKVENGEEEIAARELALMMCTRGRYLCIEFRTIMFGSLTRLLVSFAPRKEI